MEGRRFKIRTIQILLLAHLVVLASFMFYIGPSVRSIAFVLFDPERIELVNQLLKNLISLLD